MIMDIFKLKHVIEEIIRDNQNLMLARQILDVVEPTLQTIQEHEIVSELCIQVKHFSLRLKCLEFAYTNCANSEKLSPYRYELAKTYFLLNYPEKALFYNDIDLRNDVHNFYTLIERIRFLTAVGDIQEVDNILEYIGANNPLEKVHLDIEIGRKQLRNGDLDIGIKNITGSERPWFRDVVPQEFWGGLDATGKTIVVHGQGNIGDQFSHSRFIKKLYEFNPARVIFLSAYSNKRKDIEDIYRRHGIETTDINKFPKDYLWVNLSALPSYFQITEENLWEGPYFSAKKDSNNQIKEKKFKIGIKCNGDKNKDELVRRDLISNQLLDILPKNVSVYNFDSTPHSGCVNLREKINNWEDTLDYIDEMDLIISCDTSFAHASGSIGKNTIVLAPLYEHFIWISDRTDETTPWYGSNFKIVKQTKIRDWETPLIRTKELVLEFMKNN